MQKNLNKSRFKANWELNGDCPWAEKAEAIKGNNWIKGKARCWDLALLKVVSWRMGATFSRLLMNVCSDVCEALSQANSCSSIHKYRAGWLFSPQPPPAPPFCLENATFFPPLASLLSPPEEWGPGTMELLSCISHRRFKVKASATTMIPEANWKWECLRGSHSIWLLKHQQ